MKGVRVHTPRLRPVDKEGPAVGRRGGQRLRRRAVSNVVAIFELEDGKIRRETRYSEPFEPPEWRTHLVERMES
jgi:hypothetical protein